MVRDISASVAGCAEPSSDPRLGTAVGGRVIFGAGPSYSAVPVWSTDGTSTGTFQLIDDYGPTAIGPAGNDLVFATGRYLWRSDGTQAGTRLLAVLPGVGASGNAVLRPGAVNGVLLFVANGQLWGTDGTSAGTGAIMDDPAAITLAQGETILVAGGVAFFAAYERVHGRELWRTDGTAAGTIMVADVVPGPTDANIQLLGTAAGLVLLRADDHSTGEELWVSDGTSSGTRLVMDIYPGPTGSQPVALETVGTTLLFWARDPVHGVELWKSDGTTTGSGLVFDLEPGPASSGSSQYYQPDRAVLGGVLLFAAQTSAAGLELWRTDGTASGTWLVHDIAPGIASGRPGRLQAVGSEVYMMADDGVTGLELWKTDGTTAGTVMVRDIQPGPGSSRPQAEGSVGPVLIFSADDGQTGRELWRSDGTPAGTWLVKDIARCPTDSLPFPMPDARGTATMFFSASDGALPLSWALWRSDGASAGTFRLAPGPVGRQGQLNADVAVLGSRVVAAVWQAASPLLVSDGTVSGTRSLPCACQTVEGVMSSGGLVYFIGTDAASNRRLWRTDETTAGTFAPRTDVSVPFTFFPDSMLPFRGRMLFAGGDANGTEPWITDGTMAGTRLVADLAAGSASSDPAFLGVIGDAALVASTRSIPDTLWRTDGTNAGTVSLLANARYGANGKVAGETLWFAGVDNVHGFELWKSDGTPTGTMLVKDIVPGRGDSLPYGFAALGDLVLFAVDDGQHGWELWRTDGSSAGTFLVKDIYPGPAHGTQRGFGTWNFSEIFAPPGAARALLRASDGLTGFDLWITDGTAAGTRLLQDIAPAAQSSWPHAFTLAGSSIYFAADDGEHGMEPWAMAAMACAVPFGDGCAAGSVPRIAGAGGAPTLGNQAFAVRVTAATQRHAPAGLFVGLARAALPLGAGCFLHLEGAFDVALTATDAAGRAGVPLGVPHDASLLGQRLYAQWAVAEPGGAFAGEFALSPGVAILLSDW